MFKAFRFETWQDRNQIGKVQPEDSQRKFSGITSLRVLDSNFWLLAGSFNQD